jgi:predicted acyl esterase
MTQSGVAGSGTGSAAASGTEGSGSGGMPGPAGTGAMRATHHAKGVSGASGQGPEQELDCAALMAEMASGDKTPYPGGTWTVPEATYGTAVQSDVQITMSDGVVLVGDVSYPTDLGTGQRTTDKVPVLLTQNPYGAVFGAGSGDLFVTHGYIFASIDVRGTSRSGGEHDMFSPREAEDGATLVEWASKLEGSDGSVGLEGCSQLGINQLETATQLGPNSPVKAMIPACASGDFYRDSAFDNGIPTVVGSALAGDDAVNGGDMAYDRDYWKARDRIARAPAIAAADIPALFWSGWHEPGSLGSLELYTALQNLAARRPQTAKIRAGDEVSGKYQVILGDWSHAGGLDQGIELEWYDTWIKGIDTGLPKDTKTPLHLAELGGTKRWIDAKCYPLVETYTPLFLASGGKLARSAEVSAGQDMLTWVAPGDTSGTIEYASEPFADGTMLAGPLAAQLQVSSSNTNLQLVIAVLDRAPDGTLNPISQASILGSLRRTDKDKSWTDDKGLPARPYLTLDEDEPLTPDEPTQLDVPLWPSVWSIEPGHAIVVRLSTQPSSDQCVDPLGVPVGCYPTNPMLNGLQGGVYTVHHGGKLRSLISLPMLAHGSLPTTAAAASPTGSADTPLPIDW